MSRAWRGIVYGIVGAILSGAMIRAMLIPFPNVVGDKATAIAILVFCGVVAGFMACAVGFWKGSFKWGAIMGAVCAMVLWAVILRGVPTELELMGYFLVLIAGPVAVGLLGGWIGGKYRQTTKE